MAKTFAKAAPKREYMKTAIYGKAGSGKTFTSLLMSEKLAELEGKRVAYLDTEKSTALYIRDVPERRVHPKAFDIDLLETKSMFETLEAVEGIDPKVHGVLVIDSITQLWDSAKATYQGKLTSKGGIPVQAWSAIKKPYKRLISLLIDGQFHVFILGREGVQMEEDADGNTVVIGAKLKAEGESAHEPHILIRMIPNREEDGTHKIRAFFEKDRSGILTGKTIDWPNYETIEPVVRVLTGSGQSVHLGTPEEVAQLDAEAAEKDAERIKTEQAELYSAIRTALQTAKDAAGLKAAWLLTSGKKAKLGDYFEQLEALKDARKAEILSEVA